VARIDPAARTGTVLIGLTLQGDFRLGARPGLNIEETIEIEPLANVLYVGRPATGQPGSTVGLFKLETDDAVAERATIKLRHASVKSVEVISGLTEGDRVTLSDMSQWNQVDEFVCSKRKAEAKGAHNDRQLRNSDSARETGETLLH
jgi:HlyD family secretion protein